MNVGDIVDDFEGVDQNGERVRLSELVADGPLVLFFYPKAMTSGCTAQACHFRDLASEFESVGARAVGISADSVDEQAEFDRRNRLGLTLISDPDREIADILGAKRAGALWNKRSTFVIGQDRRLEKVIESEVDMELHADEALEHLRPAG